MDINIKDSIAKTNEEKTAIKNIKRMYQATKWYKYLFIYIFDN